MKIRFKQQITNKVWNQSSDKAWHSKDIFWKKWQRLYRTINEHLINDGKQLMEYSNPYQLRDGLRFWII